MYDARVVYYAASGLQEGATLARIGTAGLQDKVKAEQCKGFNS